MVENYPGFPEGIVGPKLMDAMRTQAQRFGTEFRSAAVTRVDLKQTPFKIFDSSDRVLESRAIIVAAGASSRMLGLQSERALLG